MASVDGSNLLQADSDELYDYVCGPCENEGNVKEAIKYCGDCSAFLCDPCVKHHRKLTLLKKHKLVPAHTISVSLKSSSFFLLHLQQQHGNGILL